LGGTVDLTCYKCEDLRNVEDVTRCLKSAIASKQFGYEDMLAKVVAKACIQVLPKKVSKFNVDHVRVVKILGGGVLDTHVMKGFVLARDSVGTIKHVTSAKIAVFATGIDLAKTETKANVTLKNADELLNFAKDEEKHMEEVRDLVHKSAAGLFCYPFPPPTASERMGPFSCR
jgi:T-complex protein 1 subunit theta